MNQDVEHLSLLSIFHYIVAAITALCSCLPFIHFFLGLAMALGWGDFRTGEASWVGWIMAGFAGAIILSGWALAICLALAGKYLGERSHYRFCFVMACVGCVFMPFGTVLGIFTLMVLMRPTVKQLFGEPVLPAALPPTQPAPI